jgi:antitoxin (DNA-binding transcriptional repressor) of toxin-antitoxin stability system
MARELSLRELRQNPTGAVDALAAGEPIVITRNHKPIADLVPHTTHGGATPEAFAALLERHGPDPEWEADLTEHRAQKTRDVWGDEQ